MVTDPNESKNIKTWKIKCESKQFGPTFKNSSAQAGRRSNKCVYGISNTMHLGQPSIQSILETQIELDVVTRDMVASIETHSSKLQDMTQEIKWLKDIITLLISLN